MMFYAVYRKIRGLHNIMGNILCHITHCYYMREKHITLFFNREIYLQGLSGLVFSRVVDSACKSCQEKQKHVKNRGNIVVVSGKLKEKKKTISENKKSRPMTTEIKLFSFVRLLFEKTLRIWPKYFSSDTVKKPNYYEFQSVTWPNKKVVVFVLPSSIILEQIANVMKRKQRFETLPI